MVTKQLHTARTWRKVTFSDVVVVALVAVVVVSWRLVWALARHPGLAAPLAVLLAVLVWVAHSGWVTPTLAGLALVVGLGVWWWRHRASFNNTVGRYARQWWKRWIRYGLLWWFWMGRCGLTLHDERSNKAVRPRLLKVHCTPTTDQLLLQLPAGLIPDDVTRQSDELAHAFRAQEAKTRRDKPRRVWVDLLRSDPLVETIPALPIPDRVDVADLDGLVIGYGEDGTPLKLKVHGTHILVAGVTDSGKGSIIWAVLRALAPLIRAGLVEVHAIDPKGGMELEFGAGMFTRYERDDHESMVQLLEDDAADMDTRGRQIRGKARKFTPTIETPFVLILVDELATLTAFLPDRKLTQRAEKALGLLLTKGRAPGYTVLACVQDPSKEVVVWRNLFPTKIALRLDEAVQVDMVLGEGVRELGAYADRIPETLPGVGYVKQEGRKEPRRVRASYNTDDDITTMAQLYSPSLVAIGTGEAA
ncbi:MAG: cell division protein FtsK [Propionibacteriales bacterium]|nr:cell division protein FtsK [Propionibacteriales bacterium]